MVQLSEKKIKAGPQRIGEKEPVFVIAEAGINHNGDVDLAKKLILEAKASGSDAIKFQTYLKEKRVPKNSPIFGILKQCELSFETQKKLAAFAHEQGILFFSTPFDEESADFLAGLGVPLIKIASFDIVNLKLLQFVAQKKIPMIVSRGMASEAEVARAVDIMNQAEVPFVLLHCISSYPNEEKNANLRVMETLRNRFQCLAGYSDHTLGIRVPVLAAAAGAVAIEKHFTLDTRMPGPDHTLSCDPSMMRDMVRQIREVEQVLGQDEIRLYEPERPILQYRRPSA